MRLKVQLALGVLPIGLTFTAFLPISSFTVWLESALGMAHNVPDKNLPNGILWTAVFLGVMVMFMVAGYILGWLANALISRYVLGWPTSKVIAVYMRSDVPPDWLKLEADPKVSNNGQPPLNKWEAQRAVGALRFMLTHGVLGWGAPMFAVMSVEPWLFRGPGFTASAVAFRAISCAGVGAAVGGATWLFSEWNYRKLKAKNEP